MTTPPPALPPLSPDYAALLEHFPTVQLSDDALASARPLMAGEDVPQFPEGIRYRDIATSDGDGHEIAMRIVERADDDRAHRPALLWIHGGGYVMGSYRNDVDIIGAVAAETGVVVASVEYRLAPEHPYPTPLEDCYAALAALVERSDELRLDRDSIGVAGLSAGGGLAAALAIAARDRGEHAVAYAVLDSPMLDDRRLTSSSQHDALPLWSAESNIYGWASYLGALSGTDSVPPTAAPARCEDLRGLPPTFIAVGAVDGFRDEDTIYATRLAQAGVSCEFHIYPGAPHGFRLFGALPTAEQSIVDIVRFINRQIA